MRDAVTVEFCGELYYLKSDQPLSIGRNADVAIDDDNPFLHRQFLVISQRHGMWWLSNVGTRLTATVSDKGGALHAWLAPGGSLPLVFEQVVVWFTAGATTYDFEIRVADSQYQCVEEVRSEEGAATIGHVALTLDQRLLIVALCEDVLRRADRAAGAIPKSATAAARLGWPITKFNRKLDNVCEKLANMGVRGLHGGPSELAASRKARLVEYAMAARIVSVHDLDLLPQG